MTNKNCTRCQKEFAVYDDDLELYKKISPTFGDKTFEIPTPTLCPDCRLRRILSWRNERNLYKRKCQLCDKDIVSIYSPDKPFTIYCQSCYWSDKNDPKSFGKEYDFTRPFLDQFKELQLKVPRIALLSKNSENSEYTNHAGDNKNCYLSFICFSSENVYYSRKTFNGVDIVDSYLSFDHSQNIYSCFMSFNVTNSSHLINCSTVDNCHYCVDLKNCQNCFMSNNLRGKTYYFRNEPLQKDEYGKRIKQEMDGNIKSQNNLETEFEKLRENNAIYKNLTIQESENCTGDYIRQCKDVFSSFDITGAENLRYCMEIDRGGNGTPCRDCIDCFGMGGSELNFEVHSQAYGYHNIVSNFSYDMRESLYVDNCNNCDHSFGCIGLKNASYCIFNKQYSEAEYEKLASKIINELIDQGLWGEFFSTRLSPFGYNETLANYYFPLSKDESAKIGAKWQENDFSSDFSGEYYEPYENIDEYIGSQVNCDNLLAGVIKCEVSGKPFKITPGELSFYLKNRIPIPRKHYEVRFKEKYDLINPSKLYQRQCLCEEAGHDHVGRCTVKFDTTYAPDRPEKIYCESCYQKSVI